MNNLTFQVGTMNNLTFQSGTKNNLNFQSGTMKNLTFLEQKSEHLYEEKFLLHHSKKDLNNLLHNGLSKAM